MQVHIGQKYSLPLSDSQVRLSIAKNNAESIGVGLKCERERERANESFLCFLLSKVSSRSLVKEELLQQEQDQAINSPNRRQIRSDKKLNFDDFLKTFWTLSNPPQYLSFYQPIILQKKFITNTWKRVATKWAQALQQIWNSIGPSGKLQCL